MQVWNYVAFERTEYGPNNEYFYFIDLQLSSGTTCHHYNRTACSLGLDDCEKIVECSTKNIHHCYVLWNNATNATTFVEYKVCNFNYRFFLFNLIRLWYPIFAPKFLEFLFFVFKVLLVIINLKLFRPITSEVCRGGFHVPIWKKLSLLRKLN